MVTPGPARAEPPSAVPAADGAVPAAITEALILAGRAMDARFWVPATAGNLSHRLDSESLAITRSGCHKGHLNPTDIMRVDLHGQPIGGGRPSAETLLHCQIYQVFPQIRAVLHSHSVAATVLSRAPATTIQLRDYEVLKAFPGITSHETAIDLPVFENSQDIAGLAGAIAPHLAAGLPGFYLIRGHGAYAWGPDMPTALARLEALEFLLTCELESRRSI